MNICSDLNVIKMLDNPLVSRAAFTWRYSSSKLVEPENLSTHVYEVIMIGLMMRDKIMDLTHDEEDINREEFLMKAIFHDADETILGDVPRPLKYASPGIKEEIDKVAHNTADMLFFKSFKEFNDIRDYYYDAKSNKTGMLVRIADMLCVIKKLRFEVEMLNNYTFLNVIPNSIQYVDSLDVDSTYGIFDCEETKQYIKNLFRELKKYLCDMDAKYIQEERQ